MSRLEHHTNNIQGPLYPNTKRKKLSPHIGGEDGERPRASPSHSRERASVYLVGMVPPAWGVCGWRKMGEEEKVSEVKNRDKGDPPTHPINPATPNPPKQEKETEKTYVPGCR